MKIKERIFLSANSFLSVEAFTETCNDSSVTSVPLCFKGFQQFVGSEQPFLALQVSEGSNIRQSESESVLIFIAD
jgi:hypothetical protein